MTVTFYYLSVGCHGRPIAGNGIFQSFRPLLSLMKVSDVFWFWFETMCHVAQSGQG